MKIFVTGVAGQLGHDVMNELASRGYVGVGTDLAKSYSGIQDGSYVTTAEYVSLDITNKEAVMNTIKTVNPDVVVHCAAWTAVDLAEDEDKQAKVKAINVDGTQNIADACKEVDAKMVYISTDYVYSGVHYKPYSEGDETAPCSVYGVTKLEGERLLFDNCSNAVVLRTSWLYSAYGNNFVKTMIRLGKEREKLSVVFDQIGTPTYAGDLAKAIMIIIDNKTFIPGIYNFSNEGVCSWYDFTKAIHRIAGIRTCEVLPIEGSEYPAKATRPFYSVMNKKKIKETYSVSIPYWENSLVKCINLLMK